MHKLQNSDYDCVFLNKNYVVSEAILATGSLAPCGDWVSRKKAFIRNAHRQECELINPLRGVLGSVRLFQL